LTNYQKNNGEVNMTTERDPYKQLAERLDSLPNGFPPTDDGSELRVLAKLFSPEEANLASQLLMKLETADQISERLRLEYVPTRQMLKSMAVRLMMGLGMGCYPL
jgi:Na+-translocating ferredoxin:NAD+ oxidoreductase subunit B